MTNSAKDTKPKVARFTTPPFVLSFPNLFEPRAQENEDGTKGKPKFGCAAIWTPEKFSDGDKLKYKAILAELDRVSIEAFGKPWKKLDGSVFKKGLRNGASKEGLAGYGEGTRFANLTSRSRPGVVDKNKNPIGPEEGNAEEVYPGCICRATVNVYSFGLKKGSKGKGVAIGLQNIQKIADGPRLDNRVAAADDFDEELESQWLDQDGDIDGDGDGAATETGDDAGDDFD